jgi:hypothetical protein
MRIRLGPDTTDDSAPERPLCGLSGDHVHRGCRAADHAGRYRPALLIVTYRAAGPRSHCDGCTGAMAGLVHLDAPVSGHRRFPPGRPLDGPVCAGPSSGAVGPMRCLLPGRQPDPCRRSWCAQARRSKHCSARMPHTMTSMMPCWVSSCWRLVVVNALCEVLVSYGSPACGLSGPMWRTWPLAGRMWSPIQAGGLLACWPVGWLEMAVAVLLAVACLSAWLPPSGEQQMPADLAASAGWC